MFMGLSGCVYSGIGSIAMKSCKHRVYNSGLRGKKHRVSQAPPLPGHQIRWLSMRQPRVESTIGGLQRGSGRQLSDPAPSFLGQTCKHCWVRESIPGCGGAGAR